MLRNSIRFLKYLHPLLSLVSLSCPVRCQIWSAVCTGVVRGVQYMGVMRMTWYMWCMRCQSVWICFCLCECVCRLVVAHAWTMWSMRCASQVRGRGSGVIRPRCCCLGSGHMYRTYWSLIGRFDVFALSLFIAVGRLLFLCLSPPFSPPPVSEL